MEGGGQDLAYPRLCGLLAERPSRLSQAMHNAGFRSAGLPFVYVAFPARDTTLALQAMRKMGFRGLSLTMPHKERAVPLVDEVAGIARDVGAINTVVNDSGAIIGYNTDVFGITAALEECGFKGEGAPVLLLGAGGAARAAVAALRQLGVKEIAVANRSATRQAAFAAELRLKSCPLAEVPHFLANSSLVINATAMETDYPFPLSALEARHTVFDMVTKETALITGARAAGAKVVPGIRMLLYQALEQFELFTGSAAPKDVMEQALATEYGASLGS